MCGLRYDAVTSWLTKAPPRIAKTERSSCAFGHGLSDSRAMIRTEHDRLSIIHTRRNETLSEGSELWISRCGGLPRRSGLRLSRGEYAIAAPRGASIAQPVRTGYRQQLPRGCRSGLRFATTHSVAKFPLVAERRLDQVHERPCHAETLIRSKCLAKRAPSPVRLRRAERDGHRVVRSFGH